MITQNTNDEQNYFASLIIQGKGILRLLTLAAGEYERISALEAYPPPKKAALAREIIVLVQQIEIVVLQLRLLASQPPQ